MIRRLAGMVARPRATLAEVACAPAWAGPWLLILALFAACGVSLLSTGVGQQALVDERVRVVESFGGQMTDSEYASLQARPPWWVYLTSGNRLLLTPVTTVVAACGIWLIARRDGASASLTQALALAVYASVVLLIGQLVATPLHFLRESLTSPLNLAALLPLMEEGSLPSRFFGTVDLFAVWWLGLLAVAASTLTRFRATRYLWPAAGAYLAFAAAVAGITSFS